MINLLIVPGTPYFLLALAGTLLAVIGMRLSPAQRSTLRSPALLQRVASPLLGQVAGGVVAAVCILTMIASGAQGMLQALLLLTALVGYLWPAVVLPRRAQVQREREARQLRRLTPGLIDFIRIALSSFEAPLSLMQRYCAQPNPRRALMQGLIAEALQVSAERRLRPFAALAIVARPRGCRELSDVAEALAAAEAEGASVQTVLAAQQETLELILQSEFKRMLRRRTMYLLLMVAVSLVVGILINLLFVMTAGGTAFQMIR